MKRKWLPSLLALGLAIGLIAGGCAPPAAPPPPEEKPAEVITWDLAIVWPPGNFCTEGAIEFAKLVEERSAGRLKIVVHSGGALGYKGPEMLGVVRDGLVPIGEMLLSGLTGDEPLMVVNTLPFLARDYAEAKLLGIVSRPYLEKTFAKWNQRLLYWQTWTTKGIYAERPISKLADLKGLKIRTYDATSAEWVKLAGGTAVAMPWGDVYMALGTGAINAVLTSTISGVDGKLYEVTPYFTDLGFCFGDSAVTVNLDAWEKLPDDIKVIVLDAARETENQQYLRALMVEMAAEERLSAGGMKLYVATPELKAECEEVTKAIWADWFRTVGPEGEAIVNEFLELVGR